jgi:DNA-binding NtrC family response regulator
MPSRSGLFPSAADRAFVAAMGQLWSANPFLPERLDAERAALGADFDPAGTLWHVEAEPGTALNLVRIHLRAAALAEATRARLAAGAAATPAECAQYEELVLYVLFDRAQERLFDLVQGRVPATQPVAAWPAFRQDLEAFLGVRPAAFPALREAPHLFACLYQVRRAFSHVYSHILGASAPARRLRAAVWQSAFTADVRAYRRRLYARLGDVPTLIVGPTGTGKELVARAIALSRYLPFDPATQTFPAAAAPQFFPLNLAALSPTLVEAELFGARKGAYTGALQDRRGWLEACPETGTVFLDEIGEVDPGLQVKLLRVLQTGTFQRLGDTTDRRFAGKVVAATNRDLPAAIASGRFREDFYYRLCADVIETPALADRLREDPGELPVLLRALAARVAGEAEAPALADRTEAWIAQHLPPDYPWPGNVRELEQCVRGVLIRGTYRPRAALRPDGAAAMLTDAVAGGTLTAAQLLQRYCALVYAQTGENTSETARRLQLDRRTVRRHVLAARKEAADG